MKTTVQTHKSFLNYIITLTVTHNGQEVATWYSIPFEEEEDFDARIEADVQAIINQYNKK